MLKKRIIGCIVIKNGIVVQSIGFKKYLPIGKPAIAVEYLNRWGIDEIVLIDISATKNKQQPDYKMYKDLSEKCHVPLAIGGGITHIDQVIELMHCGADKFIINKIALETPEFISQTAHMFGNQCVIVSIDVFRDDNGKVEVYDYTRQKTIGLNPVEWSKKAEDLGAGEIFLTSVNKDGSYTGYDIELIDKVAQAVKIPVIASGGAKNADDMQKALTETEVMAASAANFFHFTEHSVIITKSVLINKGVKVRLETYAEYTDSPINSECRLNKKDDRLLENLLYIKIDKEVI